jgi:hypothetical protein
VCVCFFPPSTTSASLLMCPLPFLGMIPFNLSYKPTVFSGHLLCTISADISAFIP